jgi:hypothetical protein
MKLSKFKYFVSSNGWEYAGKVLITANVVENSWSSLEQREYYKRHCPRDIPDGDTITADGVRIQFDEPFEFHGEVRDE